MYTLFLNKKQAFLRPGPVSYKKGYYFENQGLVFLKFMFLICGALLYYMVESTGQTFLESVHLGVRH